MIRAVPTAALLALAALAVVLVARDSKSPAGSAAGERPNFLVVLTDDQEVASLRVMRRTRQLIAAEGVSFENAYVTTPECCPSRASLLTGQYAHNHGVLASRPPHGGFASLDSDETLAVWLADAGYRTAYVGKYLNGYGNHRQGSDPTVVPPGWSDWHTLALGTEHQLYDYALSDDGRVRRYGSASRDYLTDVLSRKGTRFLAGAATSDRPFFLMVAPPVPHGEGPLEGASGVDRDPRPAPRDLGSFAGARTPRPTGLAPQALAERPAAVRKRARKTAPTLGSPRFAAIHRGRLESLLAVDRLVGRLIAELARRDELDNTYVIFTSDNGFLLGEHGLLGKDFPYEESARVPLLISGPGLPAGAERGQLVANIDLAPTILELADVEAGIVADGVSLRAVAAEGVALERSLLLEVLRGKHRYTAVREGRFMYARYAIGDEELYDLERDPAELDNLADDPAHSGTLRRLRAELARLADCVGIERRDRKRRGRDLCG